MFPFKLVKMTFFKNNLLKQILFTFFLSINIFTSNSLAKKDFNTQSLLTPQPQSWFQQLTPLPDLVYVSTPEQDHNELYNAFAEAKKTIDIGIFGISSSRMVEELIKQKNRGIEITIICDKYCTANEKKKLLISQLTDAKINVITASTGFSITHWKMFVIDEKKAFISTMNFVSRTNQMRDIGVFTSEPTIVKEIVSVFKQDIENSKTNEIKTPELTSPHLVWSPNNSEQKLTELIDQAKTSIDIWFENMGNKNIHAALDRAIKRSVKIRALTSVCGLGMPGEMAHPILKDLLNKGVEVRGTPFPATTEIPYIHAKMINVDHQYVFLGSENFSFNSLVKARELGLIFSHKDIEEKISQQFNKDWSVSVEIPLEPVLKCDALTPPKNKTDDPVNTELTPIPQPELPINLKQL